ncbi:MAG TPA: VWA domain-containing protein [Kofleriaceae bacterium]|nr:VWA domain-containing protein [Kofleriaceae bacterium]
MAALASGMLAPAAHAAPTVSSLDGALAVEYAAGGFVEPVQGVQSVACRIEVRLSGAVATVETREKLVNRLDRPLALRAPLAVAAGGAIVAAALTLDGVAMPALAVPPTFATTTVDDPAVSGPDPLLVQAGYAIVQPLARDREATLVTRFVALAEPVGGALRLTLPGRAGALSPRCAGHVTAAPGPGARVTGLRVAGALAKGFDFEAGDAPVTLDVGLAIAGTAPIVWTQSEGLAPEWRASLVTMIAPDLRAHAAPDRVLFVIDDSRSMALVNHDRVVQAMKLVADGVPATTGLDAIVFDRSAARVLGEFRPGALDALAAGVQRHLAGNGSDLAAAFALAHQALAGAAGTTRVVVITDGVLDADGAALTQALDLPAAAVDVHAVILDPGRTRPTGLAALQAPVFRLGGSVVELELELDGDRALADADDWFRPAALELAIAPAARTALAPELRIPADLRAGRGFTRLVFHRDPLPALVVTGHTDGAAFHVRAATAPAAPIAALAAALASIESFAGDDNPSAAALAAAQRTLAATRAAHPVADAHHALAVLSRTGRIAAGRRAVVAGGGSYERIVAVADLPRPPDLVAPSATAQLAGFTPPSAIDKLTLERLFRDQLAPRAYACFQRALVRAPKLTGTAVFDFHIGRGEVSSAAVAGIDDPGFEACLLDAAYAISPPLPNFAIQVDDQTIAHYPLSFTVRDEHPLIISGDADSSSPLDIDAIQGGVPRRRAPVRVEPATPLGGLPKP